MRNLSGPTFFYKILFPSAVIVFLTPLLIFSIVSEAYLESIDLILIPMFIICVGVHIYRNYIWDLADEVLDYGDYLLFRRGKLSQLVHLSEIVNIDSRHGSPERIIIRLREKGAIGKELVFMPSVRLVQSKINPIAEELIVRVNNAKST